MKYYDLIVTKGQQHYYKLGLWDDKPNFPISEDGYHYHYWILYENEYLI